MSDPKPVKMKMSELSGVPVREGLSDVRLDNIRRAHDRKSKLPPIEVYKREDGSFALYDGNHRLKVARERGHRTISAIKTNFSTRTATMATIKDEFSALHADLFAADDHGRMTFTRKDYMGNDKHISVAHDLESGKPRVVSIHPSSPIEKGKPIRGIAAALSNHMSLINGDGGSAEKAERLRGALSDSYRGSRGDHKKVLAALHKATGDSSWVLHEHKKPAAKPAPTGGSFSATTTETAANPKAIGKRLTKAVNAKGKVEQAVPVFVGAGKACKDEFAALHADMFSVPRGKHGASQANRHPIASVKDEGPFSFMLEKPTKDSLRAQMKQNVKHDDPAEHERTRQAYRKDALRRYGVTGAKMYDKGGRAKIGLKAQSKNDAAVKDNFDGETAPAPSPTPAKIKNVSGSAGARPKGVGERITPQGQHGGKGAHFFGAKDGFEKAHAEFAGTQTGNEADAHANLKAARSSAADAKIKSTVDTSKETGTNTPSVASQMPKPSAPASPSYSPSKDMVSPSTSRSERPEASGKASSAGVSHSPDSFSKAHSDFAGTMLVGIVGGKSPYKGDAGGWMPGLSPGGDAKSLSPGSGDPASAGFIGAPGDIAGSGGHDRPKGAGEAISPLQRTLEVQSKVQK